MRRFERSSPVKSRRRARDHKEFNTRSNAVNKCLGQLYGDFSHFLIGIGIIKYDEITQSVHRITTDLYGSLGYYEFISVAKSL
jgi:hypothetical protein